VVQALGNLEANESTPCSNDDGGVAVAVATTNEPTHANPTTLEHMLQAVLEHVHQTYQCPKEIVSQPTSDIRDFLDFTFVEHETIAADRIATLNQFLDQMKEQVRKFRAKSSTWRQESSSRAAQAESHAHAAIEHLNSQCHVQLRHLLERVASILHDFTIDSTTSGQQAFDDRQRVGESYAQQISTQFRKLVEMLEKRFVANTRTQYRLQQTLAQPHTEHYEALQHYSVAQTELLKLAARWGIRVPYQIWAGGWWRDPSVPVDENEPILTQNLGTAEVYCCISAEMLERDVNDTGRPRYHCLDTSIATDRSIESHHMIGLLWGLLYTIEQTGIKYARHYK
jgi:hypothetical protein